MAISARKVKDYDLYSGHAWYVPGVKGMFGFIGWFLLGALLGGIVQLIMGLFMSQQAILDYGQIVIYPIQFLPAMVYAANQSRKNMLFDPGYVLDNRHFEPYGMGLMILITVLMTLASMFVFDLPNYWNMQLTNKSSILAQFYEMFSEIMKQMTGGPLWSSFLVVAIFAPIFEEWLCRGMVLRGLLNFQKPDGTRGLKPVWAIVISAAFFAVIHLNPWQAIPAFVLGLLFGYVYYKTGSLKLTMLMHCTNNTCALLLSQFSGLEDVESWLDIMPTGAYVALSVLFALFIVWFCLELKKISLERPQGNCDEIQVGEEITD